ncbi:MAG: hypothetical protein CVV45_11160 [Spirochaetae bacterium HGW-Spirochaetae-10]|nr:MAG: hypothetical protein CVV45_11160 [Spirochaetae bacterium HGW-Spirochaetae-10]
MRRFINKSSLFLIFTLSALNCSLAADKPDQLRVATRKGLYLREAPSTTAPKIKLVPYRGSVTRIGVTNVIAEIDGITAPWIQASYKDKTGYMFGGYLTHLPLPSTDCTSLSQYWKQIHGERSLRRYYQIAQKNTNSKYITQEREYSQEPAIDYNSQLLILEEKGSASEMRFESWTINGAGSESLTFRRSTASDAYLILLLCGPRGIETLSFFRANNHQCIYDDMGTYSISLKESPDSTTVRIDGNFGSVSGKCPGPKN